MSLAALENFSLLAELEPAARQAVAERLDWIRLEPGLALFHEGDEADERGNRRCVSRPAPNGTRPSGAR